MWMEGFGRPQSSSEPLFSFCISPSFLKFHLGQLRDQLYFVETRLFRFFARGTKGARDCSSNFKLMISRWALTHLFLRSSELREEERKRKRNCKRNFSRKRFKSTSYKLLVEPDSRSKDSKPKSRERGVSIRSEGAKRRKGDSPWRMYKLRVKRELWKTKKEQRSVSI